MLLVAFWCFYPLSGGFLRPDKTINMVITPTNNPLTNYFKTAYQELTKVVWPTRQEAVRHTLLVIAFSLGMAIFFGAADFFFSLGLEKMLGQ